MELKEKERREALRKTGGAEGRETKAQEVQSVIKGKERELQTKRRHSQEWEWGVSEVGEERKSG